MGTDLCGEATEVPDPPRTWGHLVIALCYHIVGPSQEKMCASEMNRPNGMEISIYREILDNNFKLLMTQSKHSLTPGLAGCTAMWSQVVCATHPRDPSTARDAEEPPQWPLRRPLFL